MLIIILLQRFPSAPRFRLIRLLLRERPLSMTRHVVHYTIIMGLHSSQSLCVSYDIARDLFCISGNFSLTTPTVSRLAGVYRNVAMRLLFRLKLLHIGLRPVSTPTSAACGAAAKPVRLRALAGTQGLFLCHYVCAHD